ncbi:hypothetical protein [Pseudonocardia sp. NPDC049154]
MITMNGLAGGEREVRGSGYHPETLTGALREGPGFVPDPGGARDF